MIQIYSQDSYVRCYKTFITETGIIKGKSAIVCRDNIFFPKGGGQPCDTGEVKIDDTVLSVIKTVKMDGKVWLFLDRHFDLKAGQSVELLLDWEKRYVNMRCHTAAHVVMCSIKRNISDFSSDKIDIKKDSEVVLEFKGSWDGSARTAEKVMCFANDLVAQDLPVYHEEFENVADALEKYSEIYRGQESPFFNGLLRLVIIKDLDANPCAGTHVARLGEIGKISLIEYSLNAFKIKI